MKKFLGQIKIRVDDRNFNRSLFYYWIEVDPSIKLIRQSYYCAGTSALAAAASFTDKKHPRPHAV